MQNAKVFAGWLNGTWTEIKAYKKENAVARFNELNRSGAPILTTDITWVKNARNSHQSSVDEA